MSNEKMTPENTVNTGNFFDPTGCDSRNQSSSQFYLESTPTVDCSYQCIVCTCSMSTPIEMHQHQISVHTAEELSLSILSLQILYKMNKSFENQIFNIQINTANASNNNLLDLLPNNNNNNNNFQMSNANLTVEDSIHSKLQEEPICLKIHNRNSQKNTQETNKLKVCQKIAPKLQQVKEPALTVIKKLVPLKKEINFQLDSSNVLQPNSIQEMEIIQSDYVKEECNVPQLVSPLNVYNQPLVLNDGQLYTHQTVPIIKENFDIPQVQPTCSQMLSNNVILNSNEIRHQTEDSSVIKKVKHFKKPLTLLKIPKTKFINAEEHQFKKPESMLKNSKSSKKKSESILKSKIIIKTPETIANKEEETFHDSNVIMNYFPCVKSEEKMISHKRKIIAVKPKEAKKNKVIKEKSNKQTAKKPKIIPNKINQSSNSFEESLKEPELILKNQPTVMITRIDQLQEPKEETNNGILKNPNKSNASKMKNGDFNNQRNQPCDNFKIVSLKRKRSKSKSNNWKLVLSRSKANHSSEFILSSEPSSSRQETISKVSKLSKNLKSRNKKRKLVSKMPNVPSPRKKSPQAIEVIDDGWDNSVKEKLQVDSELPTDITKLAMQDSRIIQDFNDIQNVQDNYNCEDLMNETLIQMDPFLTSQLLQEYDFNSQERDIKVFDQQEMGNSLTELNYENELDVILDINQPNITSVDLSENVWFDENLTYAELLPVFQEENFQDLID